MSSLAVKACSKVIRLSTLLIANSVKLPNDFVEIYRMLKLIFRNVRFPNEKVMKDSDHYIRACKATTAHKGSITERDRELCRFLFHPHNLRDIVGPTDLEFIKKHVVPALEKMLVYHF